MSENVTADFVTIGKAALDGEWAAHYTAELARRMQTDRLSATSGITDPQQFVIVSGVMEEDGKPPVVLLGIQTPISQEGHDIIVAAARRAIDGVDQDCAKALRAINLDPKRSLPRIRKEIKSQRIFPAVTALMM